MGVSTLAQITERPGGGGTTTQIGNVSAGRDIHIGASPAELTRLTEIFSDQIGVSTEALAKAEARAADLATQLGFTVEAVIGFFRTVGKQEVPLEKVPGKLAEIAAQHRGGPRETKPSIAVLPFQNMSVDPTQDYFADGMVDEITTALSRVRWLHVVSRNSSFTYKGQAVDVRQVGHELGVDYVLEGSVRKSGNRVRISAQLIASETGVNLWADHFDGSLEEVFDVQDNVATSVAGVIEPTLQAAEVQRASRRPTTDLGAYDLYLQALAMMLSPARRIAEIENIFDKVLERDPDFGPALALAAAFHMNCDIMGWCEDHDTNCRKGLECGRRALTLANDDPTILVNAAFALGYFGANIHAMIVLVERALSLNPSFARGWHASGCLRLWAGQPDIAIEHIETSLRLSPRTRVGWGLNPIAAAHMTCHRFNDALSVILVLIEEDPSPIAYKALIACYAHLGRLPEAHEALSRLRSISCEVTAPASRLITLVPEFCKLVQSGLQLATSKSATELLESPPSRGAICTTSKRSMSWRPPMVRESMAMRLRIPSAYG